MAPRTARTLKGKTLLIPELFSIHTDLIAAALRSAGYRTQVLRRPSGHATAVGRLNWPAHCVLDQQLGAFTARGCDPDRSALLLIRTGDLGPGYVPALRHALAAHGLDRVPLVRLSTVRSGEIPALAIGPALCLRLLSALAYGDLLLLLSEQVRPYEQHEGETDTLLHWWSSHLCHVLAGPAAGPIQLHQDLRHMVQTFAAIPTVRRAPAKLGLVGAGYVKYSAYASGDLDRLLRSLGCETMRPGVLGLLHDRLTAPDDEQDTPQWWARLVTAFLTGYERSVASALARWPQFRRPAPFHKLRQRGAELLGSEHDAWQAAEIAALIDGGCTHVLCVRPLPDALAMRVRTLWPAVRFTTLTYAPGLPRGEQAARLRSQLMTALGEAPTDEDEPPLRKDS